MTSETAPSSADHAPTSVKQVRPDTAPTVAERTAYEDCLLAMARAVENTGMYGASHPTAQNLTNEWSRILNPLIRSRGRLTLDSNGHAATINGSTLSAAVANPVVLALLRRLYTTRAGRLELLSGFSAKSAVLMAEFLANADATHLADEEHSLNTWVLRNQIRHVRISPILLVEMKEGDQVVSGARKRTADQRRPAGERPGPRAAADWAAEFAQAADREGQPTAMPRRELNALIAFLRGTSDVPPAGMAELVARAAADAAQLSALILKSALVEHELAQRFDEPVGDDVVATLRAVVSALQAMPEAQTDEGWHQVAQTLSSIETFILGQLQALAGGTETDADVIRRGVGAIQREIEGAALKREYEQKRSALLAVERRIRKFFDITPMEPSKARGTSAEDAG